MESLIIIVSTIFNPLNLLIIGAITFACVAVYSENKYGNKGKDDE